MNVDIEWLKNLAVFVLIPVVRSLAGCLTHALQDNKITKLEWRKMTATVLNVGILSLAVYLCGNGMGLELDALAAGATAFIMDRLFGAIKDNNNVTRR